MLGANLVLRLTILYRLPQPWTSSWSWNTTQHFLQWYTFRGVAYHCCMNVHWPFNAYLQQKNIHCGPLWVGARVMRHNKSGLCWSGNTVDNNTTSRHRQCADWVRLTSGGCFGTSVGTEEASDKDLSELGTLVAGGWHKVIEDKLR